MKLIKLFISPDGRTDRIDFWIGVTFLLVLSVGSKFIEFDLLRMISLIIIAPTICLHGKRLHDTGHSAWWIMVPFGFSLTVEVAAWIAFPHPSGTSLVIVNPEVEKFDLAAKYIIWPIWTLWLGTRKSQPQDNKYGPGPEGASVEEVFE
jgi:uncharacterized membrane protein YhaH (DUF805 family)